MSEPSRSVTNGVFSSGILSDPQFRSMLHSLEQRMGMDIVTAPRVSTVSGQRALVSVQTMQSVVLFTNAPERKATLGQYVPSLDAYVNPPLDFRLSGERGLLSSSMV